MPKSQMRSTSTEAEIEFKWRDGGRAPFRGSRDDWVVEGNVAYFSSYEKLYSFDSSTGKWNTEPLPPCPQEYGSLAIVQGLLTMVGGRLSSGLKAKNKLLSLTKKDESGKWIE